MVYTFWLKCTYNFIMFMCGICTVTWWGVIFSILVWTKTWCLVPFSSIVLIFLKGCCPLVMEPIQMFRKVCCGRKSGKKIAHEV